MREPNNPLRQARLRLASSSGAGRALSRQELAEAVNAWLFEHVGRVSRLDADYIGQLERGVVRWPQEETRRAFRAVLGATTDADLGFFITRDPQAVPDPASMAGLEFAARLKDLRVRRGLSLRRLGRLVHYSHGYLWDLETGGKKPTQKVASALDSGLCADGELSALADGRTTVFTRDAGSDGRAHAPERHQASGPVTAITLTVTANPTGAIRIVIDTGPGQGGVQDRSAEPLGDARVYSLALAQAARAVRASSA